jgi:hypothetical protein
MSEPAGTGAALRAIARALRQICLLEETGRSEEAMRLEPALLDPLIQSFRDSHGADSLPEERLQHLRACERERAGDAAALGELLVPLLVEQLRRPPEAPRSPPVASPSHPSVDLPRPPVTAPGIADLLDGMLAQEDGRSARRPRR